MDNYKKSNKLTLSNKIKAKTKKQYKNIIAKNKITENDLQSLTNMICNDFKVNTINVIFTGTQIKKQNSIVKGYCKVQKNIKVIKPLHIKVFKYTSTRKKVIATKTAVNTILLHEIVHYLDYSLFNLSKSIHTAGFYKRITALKNMLNF